MSKKPLFVKRSHLAPTMSNLKHPIKWKLYWWAAITGDRIVILRRPLNWLRYEVLYNEDMLYD